MSMKDNLKMEIVGSFLQTFFSDRRYCSMMPRRCLVKDRSSSDVSVDAHDILYSATNFNQNQLIRLILGVYGGPPEPFEQLRCCKNTTEQDLRMFMKRVLEHPRKYTIFPVNHLPDYLQEVCGRSRSFIHSYQSV